MRIVCISDTHSMHRQIQVPDGDLLIHAGDCLGVGTLDELEDLDRWFSELPHRNKILIAGNHDWCFQDEPAEAREIDSPTGIIRPGCEALAERVASLTLKLHIFGHIHEDHGREQIGDCLYVNASTCNGRFKPLNPPIVIDL